MAYGTGIQDKSFFCCGLFCHSVKIEFLKVGMEPF